MSSKGSISDLFILMVLLMAIGMMMFIGIYLKDQIIPELQGMLGAEADTVLTTVDASFVIMDYAFLFMAGFFGIATVLLAFQIKTHPAWFFASLLIFAILMLVVPSISNIMQEMAQMPEYMQIGASLPMMSRIFEFYPTYFLVFGVIILIVMYAKWRGVIGGGE